MKEKGKLIWHIACDESGIDGQRYYGFGSLWMKYQRRGDFARGIRELREMYGYFDEIKWKKAHSKKYRKFYEDLTDYFFKQPWLAFHCIVFRKAIVDKETYHNNDYDLARRKHFTELIQNKIERVIKNHTDRDCTFRVELDPIASRYKKADEAFHVIANNTLKKKLSIKKPPITSVVTKDSKDSTSIQISDFLLGAVMSAWQGKVSSPAKINARKNIGRYLGWDDLVNDTYPYERKFNIWYFKDTRASKREAKAKDVNLIYPLPSKNKN